MDDRFSLNMAQHEGRSALGSLTRCGNFIDRVRQEHPEHADLCDAISARVWAMTDVARDVEGELANIHAAVRAATV